MTVDFPRINRIWDIVPLKRGDDSTSCQVIGYRPLSGPNSWKHSHLLSKVSLVLFCLETSVLTEWDSNIPWLEKRTQSQVQWLMPHSWYLFSESPSEHHLDLETSNSFHLFMLFRNYIVAQRLGNLSIIWKTISMYMRAFIWWYPHNHNNDLTAMNSWEERLGELSENFRE